MSTPTPEPSVAVSVTVMSLDWTVAGTLSVVLGGVESTVNVRVLL